jgi:hypothetical protein
VLLQEPARRAPDVDLPIVLASVELFVVQEVVQEVVWAGPAVAVQLVLVEAPPAERGTLTVVVLVEPQFAPGAVGESPRLASGLRAEAAVTS